MTVEALRYIEALGWQITDKKDSITGWPIFTLTKEVGFNTGTQYKLSLSPKVTTSTQEILIHLEEQEYGSWSQSSKTNDYFLETLRDLKQLMKFKGIL